MQSRSYDDTEGKKRYVTDIIVEKAEFCGKKSDNETESNNSTPVLDFTGNPVDENSLPF